MAAPSRKKNVAFALVALLGAVLIGTVCFVFSPEVRAGSVGLLERAGADESLARLASDQDEQVRVAAGEAVARRGAVAVPAVVARLDLPGRDDRVTAINLLGRIGPAARDAAPLLTELMWGAPERTVRKNAAVALIQILPDDPALAAEFVRMLETGDDTGRMIAADLLGRFPGRAAELAPPLTRALRDPHPEVRKEAAETLALFGPASAPAVPALTAAAANDPDPIPRQAAAAALRQVTAPRP